MIQNCTVDQVTSVHLREYQHRGLADIRAEFNAGAHRVVFCIPTGAGKTVAAAAMIRAAVAKNKSTYFLVHRQELLHQASRTFDSFGIKHGVIAPGVPYTNYKTQIVMAPTLSKRLDCFGSPDLLIVDEAHHSLANTWKKIFNAYPDAKVVGLTATPQRMDGQGLDELYDVLVAGPAVRSLISQGHLSDFEVYAPPIGISTEGIHSRAGDFVQKELAKAIDKPTITGDVVSTYIRLAAGKRSLVFCVSIQHSKNVCTEFNARGIDAVHIDGTERCDRRKQIMDAFSTGEIQVLCNVDIVSEGFNVPAIETVIMLRPTQSLTLYMQQAGRALRPVIGKIALILDHAGNALRHGLPDDQREWSLDSRKRLKCATKHDEQTAWQCPECDRVLSSSFLVCSCGYMSARNGRAIDLKEGELEKVDRTVLARLRNQEKIGMSMESYAKHRGVGKTTVCRAVAKGVIQKEPDGSIDSVKADAAWPIIPKKTGMSIGTYAKHRGCYHKAVVRALDKGIIHREPDGSIDQAKADAIWPILSKNTEKIGMRICEYARHRGVTHAAVDRAIKSGRIQRESDGSIDPGKADVSWPTISKNIVKTGMRVCEYSRHRGVTHGAVNHSIKSGRIQREPDGSIDPVKADAAWPIMSNNNIKTGIRVCEYARHRGVNHGVVDYAIRSGRIQREPDGSIDPVKADVAWECHKSTTKRNKQRVA